MDENGCDDNGTTTTTALVLWGICCVQYIHTHFPVRCFSIYTNSARNARMCIVFCARVDAMMLLDVFVCSACVKCLYVCAHSVNTTGKPTKYAHLCCVLGRSRFACNVGPIPISPHPSIHPSHNSTSSHAFTCVEHSAHVMHKVIYACVRRVHMYSRTYRNVYTFRESRSHSWPRE